MLNIVELYQIELADVNNDIRSLTDKKVAGERACNDLSEQIESLQARVTTLSVSTTSRQQSLHATIKERAEVLKDLTARYHAAHVVTASLHAQVKVLRRAVQGNKENALVKRAALLDERSQLLSTHAVRSRLGAMRFLCFRLKSSPPRRC